MELREGYKQTEIGLIPKDWKNLIFEDVLEGFSSGMTPYRAIKEYYTGNIPWITSGELNYNIIFDTEEKITMEAVSKTNLKMLPIGTFLMAITGLEAAGTRGSCGITGIKATTNQSCMALFPKKGKTTTEYLFHFYVNYGNELAFKFCQGTKQQSYTGRIAKILPINLPPTIEEQTAIATVLSDTDQLIQAIQKKIAKKRLIKQGAMQELLRPKEGWVERKLGDVVTNFRLGGNYANTEKPTNSPLIKMGNLARGHISTKKLEYISEEQTIDNSDLLERGDVLFNTRNTLDLVGKVAIWNNELPKAYYNSNIMKFEFKKSEIVSNRFMNYSFNTESIISKLRNIATGTTSVAAIYTRDLMKVSFSIPKPEVQNNIASILSDMDNEIENLEKQLAKYKELKQGLMQNLLTGKIRLV